MAVAVAVAVAAMAERRYEWRARCGGGGGGCRLGREGLRTGTALEDSHVPYYFHLLQIFSEVLINIHLCRNGTTFPTKFRHFPCNLDIANEKSE